MLLPPHAPDTYLSRLILLIPACLLASTWLHCCTSLRPGGPRLFATLPVVALFFYAPLLFNRIGVAQEPEIITIVLLEFSLTWLSSFKARTVGAELAICLRPVLPNFNWQLPMRQAGPRPRAGPCPL